MASIPNKINNNRRILILLSACIVIVSIVGISMISEEKIEEETYMERTFINRTVPHDFIGPLQPGVTRETQPENIVYVPLDCMINEYNYKTKCYEDYLNGMDS